MGACLGITGLISAVIRGGIAAFYSIEDDESDNQQGGDTDAAAYGCTFSDFA